jgi:ribosomal protein S18 acetylase RimI-like enzyme
MQIITIKPVTPAHINDLQKIARQTFFEAFSSSNSDEDMANYLKNGFSSEKLTAELNNKNSQFYFAIVNKEVAGYLKINIGDAQTDLTNLNSLEIQRIYVLSRYHGKKVGQLLYEKAIEIAHQLAVSHVWLGVWEENPRAIRFYHKNGFVEFDKRLFKLGDDEQTDLLMKKGLT